MFGYVKKTCVGNRRELFIPNLHLIGKAKTEAPFITLIFKKKNWRQTNAIHGRLLIGISAVFVATSLHYCFITNI
jgi:hypothetical protein